MILYLSWFLLSVLLFFGTLKSKQKTQLQLVTFFLLALGIFVGSGDMLGGYDRYIYAELFDDMADVTRSGGNPWTSFSFAFYGSEFGYGTLCALISYVTGNRYIFIFIVTIVIYILLIISLKDYVDNAPFAVVLFMGLWFFFTFTYLRQVIGCTIVWLSVRYIIKRDFTRFLIVWFVAFSIHNSAVIFLPMYFLPIKKYPIKIVMWVMVGALLLGLTSIPQGIFEAYGEIDRNRINVSGYAMDFGFRWAYLIEAILFLYIILANYRIISDKTKDVFMLNLALIFCAILLIFIKSENGGRLGWMFMIGVICTLSNVCIKGSQILKHSFLILLLSFILYYRILYSWGVLLYPYKTFFSDGYRAGDFIHEKYEYDNNYDRDKFYRPPFWFMDN